MSNSKSAGIYSITSKVNGKRYIGSALRICDRWNQHLRDFKAQRHNNPYLQNHYNKYGEDDLLFAVVEVVERGELSLDQFKKLVIEREQVYLDNWEECHFNIIKLAGSHLGSKRTSAKYYYYSKSNKKYRTFYIIDGVQTTVSYFDTEEEAIEEANFFRSSTEDEIKQLYLERRIEAEPKNYHYNIVAKRFNITIKINKKIYHFGSFIKEEDAISEVAYVKSLNDEDKIVYHTQKYKSRSTCFGLRRKNTKGYHYFKNVDKWQVRFRVDGKNRSYGYYKTEEAAKEKADQVKKDLGGFDLI